MNLINLLRRKNEVWVELIALKDFTIREWSEESKNIPRQINIKDGEKLEVCLDLNAVDREHNITKIRLHRNASKVVHIGEFGLESFTSEIYSKTIEKDIRSTG